MKIDYAKLVKEEGGIDKLLQLVDEGDEEAAKFLDAALERKRGKVFHAKDLFKENDD